MARQNDDIFKRPAAQDTSSAAGEEPSVMKEKNSFFDGAAEEKRTVFFDAEPPRKKEKTVSAFPEEEEKKHAPRFVKSRRQQQEEAAWEAEEEAPKKGLLRNLKKKAGSADKKNNGEGDEEEKTGRRTARKRQNDADAGAEKRGFIKRLAVIALVAVLFMGVAVMAVANFVDVSALSKPGKLVTSIITPVQQAFSSVVDSATSYLRALKVRGNIEYEYEQLLLKLDDLASEAAMAEEYKRQVNQLYDLMDEMNRNTDLNPQPADVIGHDTGNYFSVLTINVGQNQGVSDYMAVVSSGGLVGYTYDVEKNTAKVRCIIDNDATVFGMIQSSRDQGAVKGALATDGEPRCRMYYLPDNSLPRPGDVVVTSGVGMEFPKGIPIGTVRESTRGMDENMSYIVLDPIVDFQHLEYVVVYRYQPTYAEAVNRAQSAQATFEPLVTARPQPTFQVGVDSGFNGSTTNAPSVTETPAPDDSAAPVPTETPDASEPGTEPDASPTDAGPEYQAPDHLATQTPTAVPTATPSPTPAPTFDPGSMTVEDDE